VDENESTNSRQWAKLQVTAWVVWSNQHFERALIAPIHARPSPTTIASAPPHMSLFALKPMPATRSLPKLDVALGDLYEVCAKRSTDQRNRTHSDRAIEYNLIKRLDCTELALVR